MSDQAVTPQNQFIHIHSSCSLLYTRGRDCSLHLPMTIHIAYYLFTSVTLIHPILMIRCQHLTLLQHYYEDIQHKMMQFHGLEANIYGMDRVLMLVNLTHTRSSTLDLYCLTQYKQLRKTLF